MVSFKWKTKALGYIRRTTVVGFKWKMLVVSCLLQVNNAVVSFKWRTMVGFARRTTVVSLRFRNRVIGYR